MGDIRDPGIWGQERLRVRDLTSSFFSRTLKISSSRKASFYHFSLKKLALQLSLMKEVTPSSDRKMIKLLRFDKLFPPLRHFHRFERNERWYDHVRRN